MATRTSNADGPVVTPPAADLRSPSGQHSRRWLTVVSVAIVGLFVALPLRALFRQSGSPMEEGFMLVFPERVLAGDVANRDFLHLYGPGSLWVLAAIYKLAGTSVLVERVVGLVQHLGIIFGVFALARPFGRRIATVCGITAVLITITPIGLAALAWNGGVALALWGLIVGLLGRRRADRGGPGDESGAQRLFVLAGVLGAAALLYRPDLAVAIALSYGAMAWGLERRHLRALGASLGGLLVVGYGVHIAMAGPGHVVQGMFTDPVLRLRGGRRLPAPPSWGHFDSSLSGAALLVHPGWSLPAVAGPKQVVLWFYLLVIGALFELATGLWRFRSDRTSWSARVLFAAGLLSVGMLPQALQRPDTTHLAWVSCVCLALLPLYVAELIRPHLGGRGPNVATAPALACAIAVLFGITPFFTVRPWTELIRQSAKGRYLSYEVRRDGRRFFLGSEPIANAAQLLVDRLGRSARPGQRLFVGTADLRRTPYSDAYLYHLFPELTPATRYIEMDPGVANAKGSGLAHDVASADWLILSHIWDNWNERNDSQKFGPNGPNQVVASHFCKVGQFGNGQPPVFLLYRHCR